MTTPALRLAIVAATAILTAACLNPPDLVHGTVDAKSGAVTLTIQFASGTLDRQSTRLNIELDTDQNPATGIVGAAGLGIDYVLDLWGPTNPDINLAPAHVP
jgi:hypothetical protein